MIWVIAGEWDGLILKSPRRGLQVSSVDLVGWDAKSEIWNVDPDRQPNVCVCVCYSIQRTSLPLGDKLVPSTSSWRLAERIRPSGVFQNHSTNNLITLVGWTLRSSAEKRMFYWNWPTDILGWRCITSGTTLADSLDRQPRLPKTKYWLIRQTEPLVDSTSRWLWHS